MSKKSKGEEPMADTRDLEPLVTTDPTVTLEETIQAVDQVINEQKQIHSELYLSGITLAHMSVMLKQYQKLVSKLKPEFLTACLNESYQRYDCFDCCREDAPCDNCVRNECNEDKDDPDLEDHYCSAEQANVQIHPANSSIGEFTLEEFKAVCAPVVDFLYKHANPHSTVIITQSEAELKSGECAVPFELRD